MSPRDADEANGAETADEGEVTAVELNETAIREQATHHLRKALSATETAKKRYHIREALQLLTLESP